MQETISPPPFDTAPLLGRPAWKEAVARHQTPSFRRSVWQLANSLIPYLALWALMAWTLSISPWITLLLAVPAAGFLVRIFIIFHDCCHGSFFRSRRANTFWGCLTGVFNFTPYQQWRHNHAMHHASAGDLDRRGKGDVWTLTVGEYLESSRAKRLAYRIVRNPVVLFLLLPPFLFLVQYRLPTRGAGKRQRRSVHYLNATLLVIIVVMSLTVGIETFLWVQLPASMLATVAGVWLFYVQHQFEGVYWERRERWDFVGAALSGSSYYKLPRVLQWFSGNIGFHHIHHLSPGVPNYNLERWHREEPVFHRVKAITLWASMKSLSLRLWDEQQRRLVGYGRLRSARATALRETSRSER